MRLYISIASERPYLSYGYILFAVLGGGRVNIRVCSRPFKAAVTALAAGLLLPAAYRGKIVRLTFRIFSDLSPLFGDLAEMRREGIFTPGWSDVPSSAPSTVL